MTSVDVLISLSHLLAIPTADLSALADCYSYLRLTHAMCEPQSSLLVKLTDTIQGCIHAHLKAEKSHSPVIVKIY